jgi:H+-transporting ATPase
LIKYIDTYRDPHAELGGEEEEVVPSKPKPWWAFWKSSDSGTAGFTTFETPADWLNTNIRDGLDSLEVERRRKFAGWNELTTEKENMLLKFIGFFRGPILYGMRTSSFPTTPKSPSRV